MSTKPATRKAASEAAAPSSVNKLPQQGRSKASLERMLAAARDLMLERASEDFTLQEVSQRGKVSIGSIYLRFESKDNLVRAVIFQSFETLGEAEQIMLDGVKAKSRSLADFVANYVEDYAELLRDHSPILRLAMDRASGDPLVAAPGKAQALSAEHAGIAAMLEHDDEIGGKDGEVKARAAYNIIFATLARQLSLGSTGESVHEYDWNELKRELARMCTAYLRAA